MHRVPLIEQKKPPRRAVQLNTILELIYGISKTSKYPPNDRPSGMTKSTAKV